MKQQRYKFDDAWRVAMITADVDNPGRIERMIRAYIEDDIEPESTFAIERTFRGAWTVIKAQIKARKERNRRAAERRRQRRQEALAAKAAAQATQSAPQSDKSVSQSAKTISEVPLQSISQPAPVAVGTATESRQSEPKAAQPPAERPASVNQPRTHFPSHQKQKFSDRFRGPGLKASAPS